MEFTKGWAIGRIELPNIFIIQYVSLVQIIWLILYVYFIVIYYEAFFDKSVQKIIYPKTRRLVLMGAAVLGFILFAHIFFPNLLYIEYFYLKIGIIAILFPLIGVLANSPSLYSKFFKVGTYFFFYTLLYEITALQLFQWSFPAKEQFIGHVSILGYSFPFEELFFWIMISSISILSYYEYFEDDYK